MQFTAVIKIVGLFLIIFSFSMLPPVLVNEIFHQHVSNAFVDSFLLTLISGIILWYMFRHKRVELKVREAFLIVVLFWVVLSVFGSIPFLLVKQLHLDFTNAFFESASGLTTTGATILDHIEFLPNAIRFYRQELQFIGGMGIIVLAVAIFPMLGIGGMQLFRAEMPGPMKDMKLKPRVHETAKALWFIYVGLTVLCMIAYWLCGMTFFDAIGESFATVATGGFAMHDTSFGFYDSNSIQMVGVIFMMLSSTNFALHYTVLRSRSLKCYIKDLEFKTFICILTVVFIVAYSTLLLNRYYQSDFNAFMDSLFDVVSLVTTTGFTSASFAHWPGFLPILMMVGGMIGGCAASTSGGIKVVRVVLLYLQGSREVKRLIHPKAVFTIKFGKHVLPNHVIEAIWGFVAVFTTFFIIGLLLLMACGLNLETAFGAVVAMLANVGAGIAQVADNYQNVSPVTKWILVCGMFLGRLEIFTVLVLFTPEFWRG